MIEEALFPSADGNFVTKSFIRSEGEFADIVLKLIAERKEGNPEDTIEKIEKAALDHVSKYGPSCGAVPSLASTVPETNRVFQGDTDSLLSMHLHTVELAAFVRDVLILGKTGSNLRTPKVFDIIEKSHPGATKWMRRPGD